MNFHGGPKLWDIEVTRSSLYQGFFGRMFRTLPPAISSSVNATEQRKRFEDLAASMLETIEQTRDNALDNKKIPAGYTYFGQFVDHDITFDTTSKLDHLIQYRTVLELGEEACFWYQHRMRVETFFSDQKSRGFYLHQSHIGDPVRLTRLLIAACLAYIWMIYLGTQAHLRNLIPQLHRADRCDLSLFQLGLDRLHHYLEEDLDILVDFRLPTSLFRV